MFKISGYGRTHQNLTLKLQNDPSETLKWWELKEDCNSTVTFNNFPYQDCSQFITMFMVNEKLVPDQLSSFAVKG